MLSNLRAFAQSPWSAVLIFLIILSFAAFGLPGIFTGSGTAVVVVGKEQVSARELAQAYQRDIRDRQTDNPGYTRQEAQAENLGDDTLRQLMVRAAFLGKARELGLSVSDEALVESVRDFFVNPATGQYDYQIMQQTLNQLNMNENQFQDDQVAELIRQQLFVSLSSGITPPSILMDTRIGAALEQRRMRALFLDNSVLDEFTAPTDEQLLELMENESYRFVRPEYRAFTLARFRLQDFLVDIEVDETVLRDTYQYELESGQIGTPARRTFTQIDATDEATAQMVRDRLTAGETASEVAAELGLMPPLEHDDIQIEVIPDTVLRDRVFELPAGSIEIIEGNFNWYVAFVSAAIDENIPTYEERLPELQTIAADTDARNLMYDRLGEFESIRGGRGGATLEEAGAEAGVPIEVFTALSQAGRDRSGAWAAPTQQFTPSGQFQLISELQGDVLNSAFEQPVSFETPIEQYNETDYFALRVDEIIPSRPYTLDEARAEAEQRWYAIQANTALTALVESARDRVESGEALDDVAASIGGRVGSATLGRTEQLGEFAPIVVQTAFGASEGDTVLLAPDDRYPNVAVIVVDEIIPGDASTITPAQMVGAQNAMLEQMSEDVFYSMQAALMDEYELHNPVIDTRLRASALGENLDPQ